jgi:uncharacterized protein
MLITPLQLENEPLQIAEVFLPGSIDFTSGITQIGPLSVTGEADLLLEHQAILT